MALGFGSFSIRGYTAKMRGGDVMACWPFGPAVEANEEYDEVDDDAERRRASRLLPPMDCRKFRWWSADLQGARSRTSACDAAGEDASAAAGIHHAAGLRTADGIDAADCEGQGKQMPKTEMNKQQQHTTKVRTPKKRSIVELFAVAPPIENQTSVDDTSDDAGRSDTDSGKQQRRGRQVEEETTIGDDKGIAADQGENNNSLGGDDDSDVPGASVAPAAIVPRKRKLEFVEILMRKKGNKRRTRMTTARPSTSPTTAPNAVNNSNNNNNSRGSSKKRMQKNKNKRKVGAALHKDGKKQDTTPNVRLPCKVDFSLLLHGSRFKNCGNKIKKHVGKRKKDLVKCLPKKKKKKYVQTTVMTTKKQLRKCASFPVQGILKKHSGLTSSRKNMKRGDTEKPGSGHNVGRKSAKRVHFLDNNGIVSFRNEHENTDLPIESPQAASIHKAPSNMMPFSFFSDESNEDNVGNIEEVDRVSVTRASDVSQVSSPSRDNLADIHVSAVVSPSIDLNLQSRETTKIMQSLDLNNTFHDCHNPDLSTPSSSSDPNGLQSGKSSSSLEERIDENLLWRTEPTPNRTGSLLSHILDRNTSGSPLTGSISQSSVSCSVRQVNCFQSCVTKHTLNNASNQISKSQSFSAQHQKDLKDNNHLPENMSRMNPASNCQEKYITRDVIGLPLSSRGELMQWNSCNHMISNELLQYHNEGGRSNGSFRLWDAIEPGYSECMKMKDKFLGYAAAPMKSTCQMPYNTFLGRNQNNITTSPSFSDISVGCYKDHCCGLMQGDDGYTQQLEMNHPTTSIYSRGKKELHPLHASNRNLLVQTGSRPQAGSVIQPTMRLMGKDVTVTVNNGDHRGLEFCKARRDNLNFNENRPVCSLSKPSTSNWGSQDKTFEHQSSKASRQLYLSGVQNSSNLYQMISGGPGIDLADTNREPCDICRNAISLRSGFLERSNLDFAIPDSKQVVNTSSKWMNSPFSMISQNSFAETNLCKSFQSMPLNRTNHQLDQILSFGGTSCPPLQNQYYEKNFHPMVTEAPIQNLPHWLRNATQNKDTHSPYFDLVAKHQPCTVSDSICCPIAAPVCHSIISFPVNHSASNDAVIHSLTVSSSQGTPLIGPTRVMNSNNSTLKEKQKSTGSLMPGYHFLVSTAAHNHKIRKGLYRQSDEFQRPAKKPTFTMEHRSGTQEGTRSVPGPSPREVFHANRDKVPDIGSCIDLNGSEAVSLHSRRESRAGPVRLAAGAKHILKPCQNNDQDRSRPVHSTIRFAVGTNSRNILEPRAKSAKIYQF